MKNRLCFVAGSIVIAMGAGCGKKDTTTAAGPSSISDIPQASSPVSSGSSALLRDLASRPGANWKASTGLNMYNATSTSWGADGSRASCEATNMVRELLNGAAQSDKILCYIQNVMTADANKTAMSTAGLDMYDGNHHVYNLDFGDGAKHRVKFKISKVDGAIREFEMFDCVDSGTVQGGYIHHTIGSDGTISIHTVNKHTNNGSTNWNQLDVSGKLNSSNEFTSKNVVGYNSQSGGSSSFSQETTMDQYADHLVITAAGTSNFGSGSQTSQMASEIQLLDSNTTGAYSLKKLALGDGTGKAKFVGTWGTNSGTVSWDGDSLKNLADETKGTYYADVNAMSYPAVPTVSLSFGSSEKWDCSDTPDVTVTVDQPALDKACSALSARPDNGGWIDCYSRMGNH